MFSIPQPAKEELVEGCPVVQWMDSAEDWGHVLKALYKRRWTASSKRFRKCTFLLVYSYVYVETSRLQSSAVAACANVRRLWEEGQLVILSSRLQQACLTTGVASTSGPWRNRKLKRIAWCISF
jgi:hypothetical protein